jgi:hypothetical protein
MYLGNLARFASLLVSSSTESVPSCGGVALRTAVIGKLSLG